MAILLLAPLTTVMLLILLYPLGMTAEGSECNCPMTIREATQASDNTVFAQMDLDLGPENVRDTAYDMGI